MAEPAPAEETLLSKSEACAALGKSPRTIANYVSAGDLPCRYVEGKAFFTSADIDRLKADLATPSMRAVSIVESGQAGSARIKPDPPGPAALTRIDPEGVRNVADAFEHALRNALQPFVPAAPKPWLTLAEAVEYSGLPANYLVQQARADTIRAVNVGRGAREFWRFNREGLSK